MNAASTPDQGPSGFFDLVQSPLKFNLFLLQKLPAAWFSGLRMESVDEESCRISVPYKWFTKNPFRSTYFACLSMAAEMSTGILAMSQLYKKQPKVSMLVVGIEGRFYKKATGRIAFTCKEGALIKETIDNAVRLGQAQTIRALSSGSNKENDLVAEFWVIWSFKKK